MQYIHGDMNMLSFALSQVNAISSLMLSLYIFFHSLRIVAQLNIVCLRLVN